MRYLLSLFRDETAMPQGDPVSQSQREEMLKPYIAFREWCEANNVTIVAGDALAPADTATTLHHSEGERVVTDGPLLELKEQLGGFYVIECAHADLALSAAKQVPFLKACELRPVIEYGV